MKKNLKKIIAVASIAATATAVTTPIVISNITTVEAAPVNQWKNVNGKWYFYKNGKKTTGWKNFTKADGEKTNHWSYFGKDGVLRTGWKYLNKADGEKTPHWSYFGSNGWLRTGWQTMGTKANPDGNAKVHVSYFGSNGWLRTGWVKLGKGTSEPDGNSTPHYSYFGANGWLRTGWQQMGKGTGNSYGENTTKHWSYFGPNGWLRTGLITLAKGTSNPDGNQPKHQSYFGGNGWLVISKNFSIVNGNVTNNYKADSRGWVTFVNKTINATGISVNKTNLSIEAGKTATITATVKPANTTNKKVTWASSNTKIATISSGKITAKSAGTATITAKTSNGKTATCKVTVKNPTSTGGNATSNIRVTSLTQGTFPTKTTTGKAGITVKTADKNIVWKGKSKNYVSIGGESLPDDSILYAKKGEKYIVADVSKTGFEFTIKLNPTISPNGATNKKLKWEVALDKDPSAKVDQNGNVTIKWDYLPRNIAIKATTTDGSNKSVMYTISTIDSAVPWYYL